MAIAKVLTRNTGFGDAILEAARGFFRTPTATPTMEVSEERLARLADHAEDKAILTEVEQLDADMLKRVRAAIES